MSAARQYEKQEPRIDAVRKALGAEAQPRLGKLLNVAFVKLLEQYSKARAPVASVADYSAADRNLNALYQRVMKGVEPCPTCPEDGGKEGRDAWAVYYAARWSGAAPADALEREIKAALTRDRNALFAKQLE